MSKSRQTTRWLFRAIYAHKTAIRVGYVHNKRKACHEDVIRLQIVTARAEPFDVVMRLDEATAVACGLTKVATFMAMGLKKVPPGTFKMMRDG